MAFLFMISATFVYIILLGRLFSNTFFKIKSKMPRWLVLRLPCIPLLAILLILWISGSIHLSVRPIATDLMLSLLVAHSVICFQMRQKEMYGRELSSFRSLRSFGFLVVALSIAMLLTLWIVNLPYYFRFPSMILWYPVFVVNESLLIPLEVWGRMIPWFFAELITELKPNALYFVFLCSLVIVPDWFMRLLNRIAVGTTASVKIRLKPRTDHKSGNSLKDHQEEQPKGKREKSRLRRSMGLSPLKIALMSILWGLLALLIYKRIAEGMLTLETAKMAALILLRFALLPFPLAWLIIRSKVFRRISRLDETDN
jgi:hypothetical protein